MIHIAFFLFFFTNISCFYLDYKHKHPFLMIWAFNFLFLCLPIFIDLLGRSVYEYYYLDFLVFSSLCNFLYLFFVSVFYRAINYNEVMSSNLYLNKKSSIDKVSVFLFFIFSFLVIYIFYMSGWSFFSSTTTKAKNIFVYFSALYGGFILYQYYHQKKLFFFSLVLVLIVMLLLKSRGFLGYFLLPFIFMWLISSRLNFYKVFKIISIACGVIFVVVAIKAYRWASVDVFSIEHMISAFFYNINILFHEGDFSIYRYALEGFKACEEGFQKCGEWSLIDKLIASRYSGENVITPAYSIANYINSDMNGTRLSYHALSYGVAYFDGKWFGVLYFFFIFLLRAISEILVRSGNGIFILGGALYFSLFFARGSVYNSLLPFLFSIFISFLFLTMSLKSNKSCNRVKI